MANTYLQRTQATGDRRKHTLSVWVKKNINETTLNIFTAYNASTDFTELKFNNVDSLQFQNKVGNNWSGELKTTRKFRDTNAWYHIVIVWDSANSTGGDRMKMYINGVEETSFISDQNPTQSLESNIGESGVPIRFGAFNSNEYFNGSMSHVHFSDGYVYDASTFGETDATTGEWKIKTSPSFTLGTTGYSILKDGNTITDQSTNSNNFTLGGGTLTNTNDCPSNVFATLNILDSDLTSGAFQYGNTKVSGQNPESSKYYCSLTLGMMGNGKYYFEGQLNVNNLAILGVCNLDASDNPTYLRQQNTFCGRYSSSFGYDFSDGGYYNNNSKTAYGGTSWTSNDFFSFALDNTNGKMYIAKNGSWVNSGNPTNGTGGIDYSSIGDNNMFIISDHNDSTWNKLTFNFGNGSFDTTTLGTTYSPTVGDTSAKFKYNIIPTGYTALSTKGLNL